MPLVLAKATIDPYTYFAGLSDGRIVRFESATVRGRWATLFNVKLLSGPDLPPEMFLGRGLEVRIKAITWLVDAES